MCLEVDQIPAPPLNTIKTSAGPVVFQLNWAALQDSAVLVGIFDPIQILFAAETAELQLETQPSTQECEVKQENWLHSRQMLIFKEFSYKMFETMT